MGSSMSGVEQVGLGFVALAYDEFMRKLGGATRGSESFKEALVGVESRKDAGLLTLAAGADVASAGMNIAQIAAGNLAATIITKLVGAAGQAFTALKNIGGQAIMVAGSWQEMEFAALTVGNTIGYTHAQLREQIDILKEVGIEAGPAAQALTKMMQADLDLAHASDLANIAQDAARIAQINSTEAFSRMIMAIQSGNSTMLRTMGLQVDFNAAYAKFAAEVGKSTGALTQEERTQARVNEVKRLGVKIEGVYEASLQTVTGQLRSQTRYTNTLLATLGAPFQQGFATAISAISGATESLTKMFEVGGALEPVMIRLGAAVGIMGDQFAIGLESLMGWITSIGPSIVNTFSNIADSALNWGVGIITNLAQGMIEGAAGALTWAMNAITGLLTGWLAPGSPPKVAPDIVVWGQATMAEWMHGFTKADFSALSSIQGVLKQVLDPKQYAGYSKDLIGALGSGQVSDDFWARMAKDAGRYGNEIALLAQQHVTLAKGERYAQAAAEALKRAQEALVSGRQNVSRLSMEYNDLLRAGASQDVLDAKLAELNAAEEGVALASEQEDAAEAATQQWEEALGPLREQAQLQEMLVKQLLDIQQAELDVGKDAAAMVPKALKVPSLGGGGGAGGLNLDNLAGPDAAGLAETLSTALNEAIDKVKEDLKKKWRELWQPLIDWWNSPETQEMFAGLIAAWNLFRDAVTKAWNEKIKPVLDDIGAALAKVFTPEFQKNLGKVLVIFAGLQLVMGALGLALLAVVGVIAFFASGVGLAVLAIGGIIVAAALLITHWEVVKAFFLGLWEDMRNGWLTFEQNVKTAIENVRAKVQEVIDNVRGIFQGFITFLNEKLGIDLGAIAERWKAIWADIVLIFKVLWDKGVETAKQGWANFKGFFADGLAIVRDLWDRGWKIISGILRTVWSHLMQVITPIAQRIYGIITGPIEQVKIWLGGVVTTLITLGRNMIQGLIDGVLEKAGDLIEAITSTVETAIQKVKDWLGISSPSEMFLEIGRNVILGLIDGVIGLVGKAGDMISDSIAKIFDASGLGKIIDKVLETAAGYVENFAELASDHLATVQKQTKTLGAELRLLVSQSIRPLAMAFTGTLVPALRWVVTTTDAAVTATRGFNQALRDLAGPLSGAAGNAQVLATSMTTIAVSTWSATGAMAMLNDQTRVTSLGLLHLRTAVIPTLIGNEKQATGLAGLHWWLMRCVYAMERLITGWRIIGEQNIVSDLGRLSNPSGDLNVLGMPQVGLPQTVFTSAGNTMTQVQLGPNYISQDMDWATLDARIRILLRQELGMV